MSAERETRFGDSEFRTLVRNTTFLRLFLGRIVTDTGDSLYYIGAMWYVWELTGSTFFTGLAGALVQLPNLLNFLVGPLVDRWELRPVLIGTQVINGVGVLLVPVAAALDQLSVWLLLALMPVLTFVNGFVYPAQNATLPQIVDEERLTRANSLFSTSVQAVDTVARGLAGLLISAFGALALFVIDGATFAIAALLFVGVSVGASANQDPEPDAVTDDEAAAAESDSAGDADDGSTDADHGYWTELRAGVGYIRGSALLWLILGISLVTFVTMAAGAIIPAFADGIGGPSVYGLLMAALAAGNIVGTAGGFLVEEYPISAVGTVGFVLSGASWLAAVAVPGVWPTLALFLVATSFSGAFNVLFFTMVQTAVDDAFLGRVSSLARTLSRSMAPLGAFLGGVFGNVTSPTTVMYAVGVALFGLGVYFLLHPGLRSLPEVAEVDEVTLGLGTTTK